MKLTPFLVPAFILVLVACGKSNSSSKPKISITSINSVVQPDGDLEVKLNFESSSGKLSGGQFVSIRLRLNQAPPTQAGGKDTVSNNIPSFPSANRGEFKYVLPHDYLSETAHQNDTLVFKFAAIDATGKSSDTISSPKITIINL